MKKPPANAEHFDAWDLAFDACREQNAPLVVRVPVGDTIEYCKIFPSGAGKTLFIARPPCLADDRNFRESPCDTYRD